MAMRSQDSVDFSDRHRVVRFRLVYATAPASLCMRESRLAPGWEANYTGKSRFVRMNVRAWRREREAPIVHIGTKRGSNSVEHRFR